MKIEVRNIKINTAFSQETTCFTADVFADGVKIAYARNDGQGGCTNIQPYEGKAKVLALAETFAKTLPPTASTFGGKPIPSDLEWIVDCAAADKENEAAIKKIEAKLKKHMVTDICFGVPKSGRYQRIGYGKVTLERVVSTNRPQVQALLDRIRKEHCKDGVVILNTNLEQLGLK